MSPQEQTRREKRFVVRTAVTAALRQRKGAIISNGDYTDIIRVLTNVIIGSRLCKKVPVDAKDVVLAVRALHAKGVVRVAHYDSEGRFLHSVSLLRK